MKANNKLQESITLQRRVITGYEQTISENKTRRAYFIALNDYKQAAKIEQIINRDEQELNELKQQLNEMETELNTTTNTPATMNEQTKQYFRNVYGTYKNLCEQADEYLARLRYELQQYRDNASKGGAQRRRNMEMLQQDIKNVERQKEECKQAFAIA